MTDPRTIRRTSTLTATVFLAFFVPVGAMQPGQDAPKGPFSFGLSTATGEGSKKRHCANSIRWKHGEYEIDAGIDLLMAVVRDPQTAVPPWNAPTALGAMAMVGTNLQGRPCLDELARLYEGAAESEKGGILVCFVGSHDPRGIPLFVRTLDREQNLKLRVWAAGALAHWNVRRGVAELVKLLDSQGEMPQPSQLFYVRDHAMRTFRLTNIRKGWGFPDDKESAEWPPDVMPPPEVAARMKPRPTAHEIKKWFSKNEHRFPDWKLGDPLPEVTPEKKDAASDK